VSNKLGLGAEPSAVGGKWGAHEAEANFTVTFEKNVFLEHTLV